METILATINVEILILTGIMMVLDIVFGFAGGVKHKDVNSEKLRKGLWHKSAFLGLILFGYILEYTAARINLGIEIPAVDTICIYIILTEAVSIFENLCVINPELANSPFGSIFKHDLKVQQALAEIAEEKKELAAEETEKEVENDA